MTDWAELARLPYAFHRRPQPPSARAQLLQRFQVDPRPLFRQGGTGVADQHDPEIAAGCLVGGGADT